MNSTFSRSYLKLAWTTLVLIYLVIIAGSVVRSTGSGMGCPDWPKCFDQYIPPTSADQLPDNYKEKYQDYRAKKVKKFAGFIEKIGMSETADQLRNDETLLIEQDFNAAKTWTEYANRLVGFLAGNAVLILFIWTLVKYRRKRTLLYLTLLNLILMGIEAWFGSIVVATNLVPWTITLHMFLALVIVAIQVKIIRIIKDKKYQLKIKPAFKYLFWFTLLLTFVQIMFGAQVRQEIDFMVKDSMGRTEWIANMKGDFYFHRSFSWVLLAANFVLFYFNRKWLYGIPTIKIIVALILVEFATGVLFSYADMPAFTQPIHLLTASLLLGIQLFTLQYLKYQRDAL
ncbi:COX15/CtaA family protein [Paracrocinitomix mangrovi]|uniref:COX15/CtaA family protein n=1 Tax=Paracrocinitomix mangrovi TaxID=2862509 RepID=UPI001C8DDA83|nr:COX15/CtaA family protein [Paracrocinitomix mangrovi]UKN00781.1 COX15/CtaA family protein [Paracrocinitomix mangrovi]